MNFWQIVIATSGGIVVLVLVIGGTASLWKAVSADMSNDGPVHQHDLSVFTFGLMCLIAASAVSLIVRLMIQVAA